MCPNCVLNQAPLDTGLLVAFGICGLFFIVGVWAMWWAMGNGEFEDIEASKFEMMDDDEDGSLGARARAATERARAAKQEQAT